MIISIPIDLKITLKFKNYLNYRRCKSIFTKYHLNFTTGNLNLFLLKKPPPWAVVMY